MLREKGCGPQTQVCTAPFVDAASDPEWECNPAMDGEQVPMKPSESTATMSAKVCGPGKFRFSPMTCAGGRFEYKANTVEVDKSSWSGGSDCPGSGSKVDFPYNMSCYSVEC